MVDGCISLVTGGEADAGLVRSLGGPRAARYLEADPAQRYWLRTWGARGLLWAWQERATPALLAALADDAWRVREMAAQVVARHQVDAALESVAALREDTHPRVRAAAHHAVRRLTAEQT